MCLTIIIADAIAWTDVMFWKTGVIGIVFGLPSKILLWPLSLVPIKPGSAIATGYGDMAMDDFMKVFEEVANRPQIRDGLEVVLCLPVEP